MKILVSGATGMIGSHFVKLAESQGQQCTALTRRPRSDQDIGWDPGKGQLAVDRLQGFDAVIHLAGENIASGRWTAAKKARIRQSRVQSTELLSRGLAQVTGQPAVMISASAIGYYGDRGDERLTEDSTAGEGFLPGVCHDWETAAGPAADAGIRVVHPRLGVVLSTDGGALKTMLTPFRLGVGGVVGDGRQYWSWMAIDDVAAAMLFAIESTSLTGPVNFVTPNPVTNREFTKVLGNVLHRPTLVPMPAMVARLALGEMADALLLASARVVPAKLLADNYPFRKAELPSALEQLLAG